MMSPHQETLGYSTYLTGEHFTSPTGAHRGTEHQKVKVKTLEATAFSKILSARIILKLKKLGTTII